MIPGDSGTTMFPGTTAFRVVPTEDALQLVTVEEGGRLTVSDVDPATGRTEIIGTDALAGTSSSTTSLYLESVGADDVVLTADATTQVIDLGTGTVTGTWDG
jgi:hypothetical protein